MNRIRNLIVIGASAGAIKAIARIICDLPKTIDAAIMIVIHVSSKSNADAIVEILQRQTTLKCLVAKDNMNMESGKIYLAPPEHHLLVDDGAMRLNQSPEENKYRPSIDVLFRSAAVHLGNRVIGIVLTGMMEDGSSGMYAVKSCGGLCIIQDPLEADYPDMPRNVLKTIEVDYVAQLGEIPVIIRDIMEKPLPPIIPIPNELKIEVELTEKIMSDISHLKEISHRSDFVCPDCGGGLWEIKNDPTHRYRCHTGHVYTEKLLHELQDLQIKESIWISIRMLEEKRNMLQLLIRRNEKTTGKTTVSSFQKRAEDIGEHIGRLKVLLMKLSAE